MVLLVSIMVVSAAVGTAFFIGWLLKRLRQRDERIDEERLRALEQIDKNLKQYYNEQRDKNGTEENGR